MLLHKVVLILTSASIRSSLFPYLYHSMARSLPTVHHQPGDVLLGQLIYVNYSSKSDSSKCRNLYSPYRLQNIAEFIYAVNEINNRTDILPNITLGFTIVKADCYSIARLLARALYFLPPDATRNTSARWGSIVDKFHVVGLVSPYLSTTAVKVSGILSHFQIPHISPSADSQELSVKSDYKYFMRLMPSGEFLAQAMADLLLFYNWTMVSVVQRGDSWGNSITSAFLRLARERKICIAERIIIDTKRPISNNLVLTRLRARPLARAVALILFTSQMKLLLKAAYKNDNLSHFIWIGQDYLKKSTELYQTKKIKSVNAIMFQSIKGRHLQYDSYLRALTATEAARANPWLKAFWGKTFRCKWDIASNYSKSCYKYKNITGSKTYTESTSNGYTIDAVYAFAYALENLLRNECPRVQLNREQILACSNGEKMLAYLKQVDFQGSTGPIRFDSNGDVYGGFSISMYTVNGFVPIGKWFRQQRLQIDTKKVKWNMIFNKHERKKGSPDSLCSYPCNPGEFYIQGELKCCWDCQKCRINEIVVNSSSTCRACRRSYWPDQKEFTTCEPVPPRYLLWTDPFGIALTGVLAFGVIISAVVAALFVKFRNKKCIKGASRELSILILIGILVTFATAFLFLMKPTTAVCYFRQAAFHLSFTLLYGPVLVKTSRLYRLFKAAQACKRKVGPLSDTLGVMMLSGFTILIQIAILSVVILLDAPDTKLHMPVLTEKYVELTCIMSLTSLLAPLSYNVILVMISAVFGFLTRKLPDNFNESLHIFFSVVTTFIIWLTFIATYLVTPNAYYGSLLFIAMLLLNAVIFLVGLFSPKLYAVFFIPDKDIKVSSFVSSEFETQSRYSVN